MLRRNPNLSVNTDRLQAALAGSLRRFAPYNNSLEHTAKISARLRLSSIFSDAQLAPRYVQQGCGQA